MRRSSSLTERQNNQIKSIICGGEGGTLRSSRRKARKTRVLQPLDGSLVYQSCVPMSRRAAVVVTSAERPLPRLQIAQVRTSATPLAVPQQPPLDRPFVVRIPRPLPRASGSQVVPRALLRPVRHWQRTWPARTPVSSLESWCSGILHDDARSSRARRWPPQTWERGGPADPESAAHEADT